jgi:hypothetical protein
MNHPNIAQTVARSRQLLASVPPNEMFFHGIDWVIVQLADRIAELEEQAKLPLPHDF